MQWDNINVAYTFDDNSTVTQRHQTTLYDCYKLKYEVDGIIKEIICSKDHLIKVNISKLPDRAKEDIKKHCKGLIALSEDIELIFSIETSQEHELLVENYIKGIIDKTKFKHIEDLSDDYNEMYMFVFKDNQTNFVKVKRKAIQQEPQKIDENNYWIPFEGLNYLIKTYGEIEI